MHYDNLKKFEVFSRLYGCIDGENAFFIINNFNPNYTKQKFERDLLKAIEKNEEKLFILKDKDREFYVANKYFLSSKYPLKDVKKKNKH